MNTINSYLSDIKEYQEFKKGDILSTKKEDILAYLKTIKNLESTTISHKISSLKSFFKYAILVYTKGHGGIENEV